MKALVAASQCPHCGHLLDLRDSFGELLPLTHCSACNCDYLTRDGHCKWCGTTPPSRRIEPGTLWKAAGVLAFVGMGAGVWATRDAAPELVDAPNDTAELVNAPVVTPAVADTALVAPRPVGPYGPPPATTPESPVVVATPIVMESTYAAPPPVDVPPAPPTLARSEPSLPAPAPTAPVATPVTRRATRASAVRWKSVVARDWVTVRAAPRHGARLLGSLGPDTRIQLGESRDGWVRVRIRGLTGWVHGARLSTRAPRELARR